MNNSQPTLPSRILVVSLALAFAILSCLVSADTLAQSNDLSIKLHLERASIVDGKTVMVPTERAAPGEVLQYVVTYENVSHTAGRVARPIAGVSATLPIPNEMVYTGTSKPVPNSASLDGKAFSTYPVLRSIKQADGTSKWLPAPWSEYKALRWTLPEIAPKKVVDLVASVQLISEPVNATTK